MYGAHFTLLLLLCSGSLEMILEDQASQTRLRKFEMDTEHDLFSNLKRHSEGTFSSDLTHYLDKMKAKDFVEWLASAKRERLQTHETFVARWATESYECHMHTETTSTREKRESNGFSKSSEVFE